LKLGEVEAYPVFAARDLRRIGAPPHDRTNGRAVTRARSAGRGRERDAVAEPETGVGGETLIDGDRARRGLRRSGARRDPGEGQKQREADQRRADADQSAVSLRAWRVSGSVYDDAV
jgi:hypothetical protein